MKKVLAAAAFLMLAACCALADDRVSAGSLTENGIYSGYDRALNRVILKGAKSSAVLVINYPFIVCGDKTLRLDEAPEIDGVDVMITAYTAARIKELLAVSPDEGGDTITIPGGEKPVKTPAAPAKHRVKKIIAAAAIPEAAPTEAAVVSTRETPKRPTTRKLIVLDPGHGGNDPGASGHHGLEEKEVVLAVALDVKKHLGSYPADVLITRETDDFITLKNRTVFANSRKADIFVSIHCNSSPNPQVSGTRTYIYNRVASSKEAADAAKYENRDAGTFEFLMNDLRKSAYEYLSIELAGNIQHEMTNDLKMKWMPSERAPFYVLANTNMPAVLVETAFISNDAEEEKMRTPEFRDKIADGIAKGIMDYLDQVK
jgi:N-acetylmuramoyl-L-alanine amidase